MPHPDKIMGDYWVVVLGATGEKPTCYILKLEEVKSLVSKYAAKKDGKITYWLPKQLYAVEDYLEMWEQKIGFGAKKPTEEQPSDPLDDAQDDSEGNRQQEIPK
jgi:hypothetical protein